VLRALRALLRRMFEAAAIGQPVTDAQLEELNAFLALTPVMRQVQRSGTGVRLQTVVLREGWTAVASQVAASWVEVLARIPPTRLKVCANPACHWVFIDQSHNLSRCWCRQWACGNLMKVRQFRARAQGLRQKRGL
jgi:predicted RNA-binding Zn ribbon-like protein